MSDVEHVRVVGEGWYANAIICGTCGLCVLDWDEHCNPSEPLAATKPAPVERDPRESQIDWESKP